jgi:cysteine-S-conjugate beta-lyase
MNSAEYDFDQPVNRRGTDSIKWGIFDPDVLPMWIADMDFPAPSSIIDAMHQRIRHGVFGYPKEPPEIREVVVSWILRRYNWKVKPEDLMFLPNVAVGFNLAIQAIGNPGKGLLFQPPIYFPILDVPRNAGMEARPSGLIRARNGSYEIDFDDVKKAAGNNCSAFILCNPHNPVGRVFDRKELERLAEICLENDLRICSDEIHADFVYDGRSHIPIASMDPEIASRTITLIAPNKSFNLAGISLAIAVVPNQEIRERVEMTKRGLVQRPGILSYIAAEAAYTKGEEWFDKLTKYLEGNRDYLKDHIETDLPQVSVSHVEGTYLAWLDCRKLDLGQNPHQFFLQRARVGLNDGARFGKGGDGFVRLNFATQRSNITHALRRMQEALLSQEDSS